MIIRIVGELKVLNSYTCSKCYRVAAGTTMRVTVDEGNLPALVSALKSQNTNLDFPIGWCSSEGGFTCDMCKSSE